MLKIKAGLNSAVDGDGAAILDADTGLISTLNPTGAYIWNKLATGMPLEDIIAGLARETGEAISTIEPDVHRFLEHLRVEGLLKD